jgi:hypothetical protein
LPGELGKKAGRGKEMEGEKLREVHTLVTIIENGVFKDV